MNYLPSKPQVASRTPGWTRYTTTRVAILGKNCRSHRIKFRIYATAETEGRILGKAGFPRRLGEKERRNSLADLIGEKRLVVSDSVHGTDQARDAFAFRDVAARSRRLRHVHHAGALVHGQQKYPHTGKALGNFSRSGKTVENRHGDVQDHEVRPQLGSLFESFQAIRGFPANLKAPRFENRTHTRS
jgi:hypothetical protein